MSRKKVRTPGSIKQRDMNIAMNATMEINLGTRSIPSKKVYNRKKFKMERY
jgi:hypothetical protein